MNHCWLNMFTSKTGKYMYKSVKAKYRSLRGSKSIRCIQLNIRKIFTHHLNAALQIDPKNILLLLLDIILSVSLAILFRKFVVYYMILKYTICDGEWIKFVV